MKPRQFLKFEQPAGTFYLTVLTADEIGSIYTVDKRSDGSGHQRDESKSRRKEIALYCEDPDAAFPTPIILAIDSENVSFSEGLITINNKANIASVLDGQHRISGILQSKFSDKFELPVVIVVDATEEEKAYIFSIINSKQTRVSPSLIFDLFNVSTARSPQKTCHEVARSLNSDPKSPFHQRLKMLGKGGGQLASISQGSFINSLMRLITKYPDRYAIGGKNNQNLQPEDLPFNKYYLEGHDDVIRTILFNLFSAVATVFPVEWSEPSKYILSKAIGYGAILESYPMIHNKGLIQGSLKQDFFCEVMIKFQSELEKNKVELTSEYFSSNAQGIGRLSKLIEHSLND